ncbi:hypothetical protein LCGC14_2851780, partial [marine sediment metagenome]
MIDISNHGDVYITINTDIASEPRLTLTFTRHDETSDKGQVTINLLQADDLRVQRDLGVSEQDRRGGCRVNLAGQVFESDDFDGLIRTEP